MATSNGMGQALAIGQQIRARRRELKLTLKQLSETAGLSLGFLSLVERGQSSPSLSSLTNIAKALGLPMRALMDIPEPQAPDTHEGFRKRFAIQNSEVQYERLSSVFAGSTIRSVKMKIPAGSASEMISHAGEELTIVLKGEIEYLIEETPYRLKAGDSIHFEAWKPHSVRSINGEAEMIWVGTLDVYDDTNTKNREELNMFNRANFHIEDTKL